MQSFRRTNNDNALKSYYSLAFPGGQSPEHPWGNPGNIPGIVHFVNKNFPQGKYIVWFFKRTHQIPGMHQLDMFDSGHDQWYFPFKILAEHVGKPPCFHLNGISWRSSVFVTCLFFIMPLFKAWDLVQGSLPTVSKTEVKESEKNWTTLSVIIILSST